MGMLVIFSLLHFSLVIYLEIILGKSVSFELT